MYMSCVTCGSHAWAVLVSNAAVAYSSLQWKHSSLAISRNGCSLQSSYHVLHDGASSGACLTLTRFFVAIHCRTLANMDAARDLKRSGSKMPHVPSFNDFCSGVEGDVLDMPQLKVPKQAPPMVERSWSVDSQEGTPR